MLDLSGAEPVARFVESESDVAENTDHSVGDHLRYSSINQGHLFNYDKYIKSQYDQQICLQNPSRPPVNAQHAQVQILPKHSPG